MSSQKQTKNIKKMNFLKGFLRSKPADPPPEQLVPVEEKPEIIKEIEKLTVYDIDINSLIRAKNDPLKNAESQEALTKIKTDLLKSNEILEQEFKAGAHQIDNIKDFLTELKDLNKSKEETNNIYRLWQLIRILNKKMEIDEPHAGFNRTEFYFKNYIKEQKEMPHCAEKVLIDLMILINSLKDPQTVVDDLKIQRLCNEFQEAVKTEAIEIDFEKSFEFFNPLYESKNYEELLAKLVSFRQSLNPFNVFITKRLVKKSKSNSKKYANRKVIGLNGGSGSGKTTLANFVSGSIVGLRLKKVGESYIEHIDVLIPGSKELEKMVISWKSGSETMFSTPVEVIYKGESYLVVDTAGTQDNRGAEIDAANMISMVESLEVCEGLKIIFLMNYMEFFLRKQAKPIIETLINMVSNTQSNLQYMTFLFTRFSSELDKQNIKGKVEEFYQEAIKDKDKVLEPFFRKMAMDLEKYNNTLIVDPINGNKDALLDIVIPGDFMLYPQEKLKISINDRTKKDIKEQLNRDVKSIENALLTFDIKMILCKLQSISQIQIEFKLIDNNFDIHGNCISMIANFISKVYKQTIESFNRNIIITKEDCLEYLRVWENAKKADALREFIKEIAASDYFFQNINKNIQLLLTTLKNGGLKAELLSTKLDKLNLISLMFPDFVNCYNSYKEILSELLVQFNMKLAELIKNNDFEKLKGELSVYKYAFDAFEDHKDFKDIVAKNPDPKEKIIDYLKKNVESLLPLTSVQDLSLLDFDKIVSIINILHSAEKLLEDQIPNILLKKISDDAYTLIYQRMCFFEESIKSIFSSKEIESPLKETEVYYSFLSIFKKMPIFNDTIKSNALEVFHAATAQLRANIKACKDQITTIFMEIKCGKGFVDYEMLLFSFQNLIKAEWVHNFLPQDYSKDLLKCKEDLFSLAKAHAKEINEILITLDNPDNVTYGHSVVKKLGEMTILIPINPALKQVIEETTSSFHKCIDKICQELYNEFSINHLTKEELKIIKMKKLEKALTFLTAVQEISLLQKETSCNACFEQLTTYIDHLKLFLQDQYFENFQNIENYKKNEEREQINHISLIYWVLDAVSKAKFYDRFYKILDSSESEDFKSILFVKLRNYYSDISVKIDLLVDGHKIQEAEEVLDLIRHLRKLDDFLNDQNSNFSKIFQDKWSILRNESRNLERIMESHIDTNDFSNIKTIFNDIGQANNAVSQTLLEKGKNLLNKKCSEDQEKCLNLLSFIGENDLLIQVPEKMQNLENMVKSIKKRTDVDAYLQEECKSNFAIKALQVKYEKVIEGIFSSAIDLIDNQHFKLAETRKDLGLKLITMLSSIFDITAMEKSSKSYGERRKAKFESLKKTLKNSELDGMTSPKEIYDELSKIQPQDFEIKSFIEDIDRILKEKFVEKIRKITSIPSEFEQNNTVASIRIMISNLLPPKYFLVEELNRLLENEKSSVQNALKIKEILMENAINQKNYNDLCTQLDSCKEAISPSDLQDKAQKFLISESKICEENINALLKKNGIRLDLTVTSVGDILNILEQSCRIKDIYSKYFPSSFLHNHQNILKIMCQLFDEIFSSINCFLIKSVSNQAEMNNAINDLKVIIMINSFNKTMKDLFSNAIMKEFSKNSLNVINSVILSYRERTKSIHHYITNNDFQVLDKVLSEFRAKEEFYTEFQKLIANLRTSELITAVEEKLFSETNTFSNFKTLIITNATQIKEKLLNAHMKTTKAIQKEYEAHYSQINQIYLQLLQYSELSCLQEELSPILSKGKEILLEKFKVEENMLQDFMAHQINETDWEETVNSKMINLCTFEKCIQFPYEIKQDLKNKISKLENLILSNIDQIKIGLDKNMAPEKTKDCLVFYKMLSERCLYFKDKMKLRIDNLLKDFRAVSEKMPNQSLNFANLTTLLQKEHYGKLLISDHSCFKGDRISILQQEMQKRDIDFVLKNLKPINIKTQNLKNRYNVFRKKYEDLLHKFLNPNLNLVPIKAEFKSFLDVLEITKFDFSQRIKDKVPEILAYIFAIYTIQNAMYFYDQAEDNDNRKSYLITPHPTQIIAIFRLLSVGDDCPEMENNLAQVKTGQGKSLILAAVGCVLALLGANFYVACFSKNLVERDWAAFYPLFEALDLTNSIKYGTFNKLCEEMINHKKDIRSFIRSQFGVFKNQSENKVHNLPDKPIIIGIDEVDTVFDNENFAENYSCMVSISDPTISSLIKLIWREKENCTFALIKATEEYIKMLATKNFKQFEVIFDNYFKSMVHEVKNFKPDETVIVGNDKIGYNQNGEVNNSINYGLTTVLNYCYQHEKGNISSKSLDEHLDMGIKCFKFSLAEILQTFYRIVGVTGTLILSKTQEKLLADKYQLFKITKIPSYFGKNKPKFNKIHDIQVVKENIHYQTIMDEILAKITGHKRAVLVAFKNRKEIHQFRDSSPFQENCAKFKFQEISEDLSPEEKNTNINNVTLPGYVTLITEDFTRGTDFVCINHTVNSNGGLHVIITYFPKNLAAQKQIMGRTARQGKEGSCCMILCQEELMDFGVSEDEIIKSHEVYDLIDKKRNEIYEQSVQLCIENAQKLKKSHDLSIKMLSYLNNNELDDFLKYLLIENPCSHEECTRTIFAVDGTYSMTRMINVIKSILGIAIDNILTICRDNNLDGLFLIQFIFYGNYDSSVEKILRISPMESNIALLTNFLSSISATGGWGNEAIEVGLNYIAKANEENPISQVVLIGDAPPNTEDDIEFKRENGFGGKAYWEKTIYNETTSFSKELEKIKEKNIPIHAFYLKPEIKNDFESISRLTKGRSEFLDINSSKSGNILTNLMTEEILRIIGNSKEQGKGDKLVNSYHQSKYYTS